MKIDKGIPIPKASERTRIKKKESKYSFFDCMEIGDSVFIKGQCSGGGAMNAAYLLGKKTGKKFKCKKERCGLRIWRIE